jgi:hypothetical protein
VTPAKEMSYRNQHLTDQFLPLAIVVFGCLHKLADVFLHDCTNAIWSLKGTKGLHLSTLVIFFIKKFKSHYKDASILHLKLGGSRKLSYLSTSTPSKHTSHHHGRSIASHWFLTYKYGQPSIGGWLWTWRDFHSYFEPT